MAIFIRLVGGPASGQSVKVPEGANFGDTVPVTVSRQGQEGEGVFLEQKEHYRLIKHPHNKVIGSWINPADRHRFGPR